MLVASGNPIYPNWFIRIMFKKMFSITENIPTNMGVLGFLTEKNILVKKPTNPTPIIPIE